MNQYIHHFFPGKNDPVTLILLHGTGGDENDLVPLARQIRPGANLLTLRGDVQENGMNRFFKRFSPQELDLQDLDQRTHTLKQFIEQAQNRYGFSPPIVALGYSNGANITANLLLQYPDCLSGAILLRPLLPQPIQPFPDLSDTRVLVLGGKTDTVIVPQQTRQLIDYLKKSRCQLTEHWLASGHRLIAQDTQLARKWLEKQFPIQQNPKRKKP